MATYANIEGLEKLFKKIDDVIKQKDNMPLVKIGIVETAHYPTEAMEGRPKRKTSPSVADVAMWNEFGTKGGGWGGPIPERPFMRNTVTKVNADKTIKKFIQNISKHQYRDQLHTNAGILGGEIKALMVQEIDTGNFVPNSDVTIKFKLNQGKTAAGVKPLIDTGFLKQQIDYEVLTQSENKIISSRVFHKG